MSQPSAYEQYLLELINAERAKVGAPPLAFDGALNDAAEDHSQWMIATDTFSHSGNGGSDAGQRMSAAGYTFMGSWTWGENIALASTRPPTGYQDEVQLLHTNLMNSSGHRANILNVDYREIGIGFEVGEYGGRESAFVTEDFARFGSSVFLTGIAFDDKDGDKFYDPGEGLGGLTVTAQSNNGAFTTTTMDAGGYDLALATGTYTVTFSGGGYAAYNYIVTVGSSNVKLDFINPAAQATGYTFIGLDVNDVLVGFGGNDVGYGGNGNDYFYAGAGNDLFVGGAGVDVFLGQAGNDTGYGGDAQDYLFGGDGNDVLIGEGGVDVLLGEAGDDAMYGGAEGDYFYGYADNDTGYGGDGNDIFVMDAGNDTAFGDAGQDYFYMGDGNDVMYGGDGIDVLLGEAGDDSFDAGSGVDYLFLGAAGNDTVIINGPSGIQVINDFEAGGTNDMIRFQGTSFRTFDQVLAGTTDYGSFSIVQVDVDTSLWLIGVTPSQLTAADFLFV